MVAMSTFFTHNDALIHIVGLLLVRILAVTAALILMIVPRRKSIGMRDECMLPCRAWRWVKLRKKELPPVCNMILQTKTADPLLNAIVRGVKA